MPDASKTLRQQFSGDFSRSAFKSIDVEQRIVGKFGQIAQIDNDLFDVWFVDPDLSPLSEHKLTAIEKKCGLQVGFRRLTGEADARGRGRAFVHLAAHLAGVKKKRKVAPGFVVGKHKRKTSIDMLREACQP